MTKNLMPIPVNENQGPVPYNITDPKCLKMYVVRTKLACFYNCHSLSLALDKHKGTK